MSSSPWLDVQAAACHPVEAVGGDKLIGAQSPVQPGFFFSTTVRVHEGNTVVMAGLISQVKNQQQEGVSGLGNLPLVGGWFKHVEDKVQTRELVIFITPHIRKGA